MRDNRRLLAVGRYRDYFALFFSFVERFVVDSHLVGIWASLEMIGYVLLEKSKVFLVRLEVPKARTDMRQWKRALLHIQRRICYAPGIVLRPTSDERKQRCFRPRDF